LAWTEAEVSERPTSNKKASTKKEPELRIDWDESEARVTQEREIGKGLLGRQKRAILYPSGVNYRLRGLEPWPWPYTF
jgi:hypothetical protein